MHNTANLMGINSFRYAFKLTNTGKVYYVLCLYLIKNATEPAKQSNSTGIEIVFKKVNITVLVWNGNSKQGQGSQGEC